MVMVNTKVAIKLVNLYAEIYDKFIDERNDILSLENKNTSYVEIHELKKELDNKINTEIYNKLSNSDSIVVNIADYDGSMIGHEETIAYLRVNDEFSKPFNVWSRNIEPFDNVVCRLFGSNFINRYYFWT
ncbi:MAG: hypothetical protein [Caudoviricetes sp.]|nr:MAG: hypothetical protein [Caudoviricetes sp.]